MHPLVRFRPVCFCIRARQVAVQRHLHSVTAGPAAFEPAFELDVAGPHNLPNTIHCDLISGVLASYRCESQLACGSSANRAVCRSLAAVNRLRRRSDTARTPAPAPARRVRTLLAHADPATVAAVKDADKPPRYSQTRAPSHPPQIRCAPIPFGYGPVVRRSAPARAAEHSPGLRAPALQCH
jgi:hypothetical protein